MQKIIERMMRYSRSIVECKGVITAFAEHPELRYSRSIVECKDCRHSFGPYYPGDIVEA